MTIWTNMSKVTQIIVVTVAALLVIALVSGLVFRSLTLPPGKGDNEIMIDIPIGTSTVAIANLLEEQGVIKSAFMYRLHLRQNDYGDKLQAGTYMLNDGLAYEELTEYLLEGRVYRETIRFTIPEGLKVEQIASRLASIEVERTQGQPEGLIDEEVFLDLVQNGEFDYWFINQIPQDVDYRLEGYLFPNTYEIYPEATEWDIIDLMLRNFDRVFTDELKTRTQELGMSVHEVVTLASIVEREAVVDKERPVIAGVFHNRLNIDMALESCATVFYFTGREPVLISDTQKRNPYNTYVFPGLPPGPIGAPGKMAIKSTLHYEETDYLFFVTKKDGSGEHYFAETYQEHLKNDNKSRNN